VTPITPDILLVAVNARYSHSAYAVRSLLANLGSLADITKIIETDLEVTPLQLASQIVEANPRIVGFSVYLWNVRLIEAVARILHAVAPHMRLIAGGPEFTAGYRHASLFDSVIVGEGETAFRTFCERWLAPAAFGSTKPRLSSSLTAPGGRASPRAASDCAVVLAPPENLATLALPFHLYTGTDLAQRTIYVESSRGCPYACSYCTSASTGLRLVPLDRLLPALDTLWQRGLRRFKFLDRSFNAPAEHAVALLDFFLSRATPDMCLHFEINTDHLTDRVASRIASFPKNTLHLEAGIQTLNPRVAVAVGRSADTQTTLRHLRYLTQETGAVVHADLIFGLPGEDEASFALGFNSLVDTCHPPEVQVNLLKALPGTRLAQEASDLGLAFNTEPPYELLHSDVMNFAGLMRLQRFARCWELVHNRSRFPNTVCALHASCAGDYYGAYQSLATRIHAEEGKLFAIGLSSMVRYLREHLVETCGLSTSAADKLLAADLNGKRSPERMER
jgi:radical SAM superfamily enzyme YgiQ (UPF0313 family)